MFDTTSVSSLACSLDMLYPGKALTYTFLCTKSFCRYLMMESPRIKVSMVIASKVASDKSCEYVNIRIEYEPRTKKSNFYIKSMFS